MCNWKILLKQYWSNVLLATIGTAKPENGRLKGLQSAVRGDSGGRRTAPMTINAVTSRTASVIGRNDYYFWDPSRAKGERCRRHGALFPNMRVHSREITYSLFFER